MLGRDQQAIPRCLDRQVGQPLGVAVQHELPVCVADVQLLLQELDAPSHPAVKDGERRAGQAAAGEREGMNVAQGPANGTAVVATGLPSDD
jgi:hypothetical protein